MPLTLPPGPFRAYLFDCDGTIADSMPLQRQAWLEALAEWGCDFPAALFYAWAGIPVRTIVEMLNARHGLAMPPDQVTERREQAYFALLPRITPVAAVVEHIQAQHTKLPLAVVSGSPRASVVKTLTFLHLLDRFDLIVGAEDYAQGKPHPEPYLTAARRLGVAPRECLVFEDGDLGIESARAAGMSFVKVPGPGV